MMSYIRVFLADHKMMPGNHLGDALPNKYEKKNKYLKNLKKVIQFLGNLIKICFISSYVDMFLGHKFVTT